MPKIFLQRHLLTGILTLLPLWLTWVVFTFVLGLLSGLSEPWINWVIAQLSAAMPAAAPLLTASWLRSAIAVLVTLTAIYLVGWATHRVLGQRLIAWLEALVARIPLVQTIYGGTKKLLELMQTRPDGTQRVVLVDFPHKEMRAVGLVTRILTDQHTGKDYAAVYVPTTPNPTSGYLEIIPVEKLTPTDWTMDQAMAFIISGGAMAPDSFHFDKKPAVVKEATNTQDPDQVRSD